MKKTIIFVLATILIYSCKQSPKTIDEQQLLGTWETIDGFDFEEITFSIEEETKTLNLVFGQRANYGTWKIEEGNLIIEGPYDTLSFNEVQFFADTLILVQGNGENSVFIRYSEKQCNAIDMLNSLKEISKTDFSEIADTILAEGINAYFISLAVEVTDDFSVLGNSIAPLVDEVRKIGFELDNELITEMQTGYSYNDYRLIITNQYKSPSLSADNTLNDSDDSKGIYEVIIICYCN